VDAGGRLRQLSSRSGKAYLPFTLFIHGRVSNFVTAFKAGWRDAAGRWRVINVADRHLDPAAADQRRHRRSDLSEQVSSPHTPLGADPDQHQAIADDHARHPPAGQVGLDLAEPAAVQRGDTSAALNGYGHSLDIYAVDHRSRRGHSTCHAVCRFAHRAHSLT
jgi:hypothetical protein